MSPISLHVNLLVTLCFIFEIGRIMLEEIVLQYPGNTHEHFRIDAIFLENFIKVLPATWNLPGKSDDRPPPFVQFCLNQLPNRYHRTDSFCPSFPARVLPYI